MKVEFCDEELADVLHALRVYKIHMIEAELLPSPSVEEKQAQALPEWLENRAKKIERLIEKVKIARVNIPLQSHDTDDELYRAPLLHS